MTLRSLLFVPGNRPERFDKAAVSGVDAIILDLEDAVAAPDKALARVAVAAWLRAHAAWLAAPSAGHPLVLVRINACGTPWFEADVQACAAAGLREWMLPKSEHTTQLQPLQALPQAGIWPLIESAQGMAHVQQLAAAPAVRRLVFGSLDFLVDMGMEADAQESELAYYRAQLVLASRVAALPARVDGVSTALDDRAGLEQATQRAVRQAVYSPTTNCRGACRHGSQCRSDCPGSAGLGGGRGRQWRSRGLARSDGRSPSHSLCPSGVNARGLGFFGDIQMIKDPETFNVFLQTVERFVKERLVPAEHTDTDAIPDDIVAEMKAMGLFGLTIPEEFGGLGVTMEEEARLMIAMGHTSPAFRSLFGTTVGFGSQGILMDGTPEQKAKYLPRLATGELIASFALTEPEAGSDAASLRTTAKKVSDPAGDYYLVNGTKRFITNAPLAGMFTLMARTDSNNKGADGVTAFIVDRDTPGISIGQPDKKIGHKGAWTADVIFEDVKVPASQIIGG